MASLASVLAAYAWKSPVRALALALALAACAQSTVTAGNAPFPARPTGADDVVVQVMLDPTFGPPEDFVSTTPTLTVLGDSLVITPAPVPEIYPGPAMVPHQSVRADAAVVDDLVKRAAELGLLADSLDFSLPTTREDGQPVGLVADAANTVVVINAGGRTYRHSAYALEFASGDTPARRALSAFVDATQDLPPGESPWEPEAIAVYLLGAYRAEPELPQPEMRWPLSTLLRRDGDPAVDPSCTLVAGADATTLRQALNRATARTPWAVDGKLVSLAFRPLLPGQPGCEPAEK